MQIKSEIRKIAGEKRKSLTNKRESDLHIAEKLFSLDEYKNAKTVLVYASLDDEVKTDCIIENALQSNKQVAVPLCKDKDGNMDFYIIMSISELKKGHFGVREPNSNLCNKLESFENSVIIVPGLCFDKSGNRLGYGKGYYDRFLSKHSILSVGLCYEELIFDELPTDKYDKKVDYIISQHSIINGG